MKYAEYSLLKIPLDFISSYLRENIRRDDEDRVSLEEYIRAFKIGNVKNKKRVFTMIESGVAEEPAQEDMPQDNPIAKLGVLSSNPELFQ